MYVLGIPTYLFFLIPTCLYDCFLEFPAFSPPPAPLFFPFLEKSLAFFTFLSTRFPYVLSSSA